jgi:putative ABC transport system permease protein
VILRALVLRPILRERLRTALTILGIAVGVAVVVAIALSNQSALRAFRESVDAVAGRANYMIVSDTALDENLLLALQPLWARGVRFAPVIDVDGIAEAWQTPVRLLAVDLFSDLHFRDYRYAQISVGAGFSRPDEPGRLKPAATQNLELFRDDSAIVPVTFAREHGLHLGSPLALNVGGVSKTMIVRGILEPRGPATAFNGAIVVVDIAAAQASFAMAGRLSRIDLLAGDDALPAIRKLLPPNARLERPSRRNERVEKMLRAFRVNLFALAGVALLVGMFLVYNTVLISILRRRKDVGVFKTLGASARQIFAAFIAEGFVFGVIGSAIGIALGRGLAFVILKLIGRTVNALYVTSQPEAIALTPSIIGAGVAVGTVLALASAVQPSWEAAGVRPGVFLNVAAGFSRPGRLKPAPTLIAFIAFLLAALATRLPPIASVAVGGYVAVLLVIIGFSALAPMIVTAASRALRVPFRAVFGIVGQLASASIPASLRRTSIATAALSLAIGMMVAVALMVGSFRETVRVWVDQTVSSDLWLRPAKGLSNSQVALFPNAISADLAKVPFIEAFDRVRGRDMTYGDAIIFVGSADSEVAMTHGNVPMVTPSTEAQALREARARDGVMVSESFATKFDKSVGDVVVLGTHKFPITGIYRDYSNDRGVVFMDRRLYTRLFGDDTINTVVIYLRPGIGVTWARRELERTFGPKYHAFTVTNGEIRAEVMKIFDQTFLITYALLAVAIVVAVLGIVNTLAALIIERTRELALLRVLGMTVAEVRRMLVLESAVLGITSTAVGVAMGYVLSWILIYVINKQSFGWTIQFHTPVRLIVASLAVTFAASLAAGMVPSRLARRIDLAAAMKTE